MKQHTIDSIRSGLLAKEFSAEELAKESLAFAEAENPKTNAYLTLLRRSCTGGGSRRGSRRLRLEKIRVHSRVFRSAVKDVIVTKGLRTTCAFEAARELHSAVRRHGGHPAGAKRAASLSARPTAMSSRWARRMRTRRSDRCATLWRWIGCLVDRAAARLRWWRRIQQWFRWVRIPAARFASLRRSAASRA